MTLLQVTPEMTTQTTSWLFEQTVSTVVLVLVCFALFWGGWKILNGIFSKLTTVVMNNTKALEKSANASDALQNLIESKFTQLTFELKEVRTGLEDVKNLLIEIKANQQKNDAGN